MLYYMLRAKANIVYCIVYCFNQLSVSLYCVLLYYRNYIVHITSLYPDKNTYLTVRWIVYLNK